VTVHFEWSSFALQTVNFAILVWLLHRFLYRPVLRLIDARRAEIDQQYADARIAEDKAKTELAAVLAERSGIAGERATALAQAAAQAEAAAAERLARAEREAAVLLDRARTALAAERRAALAEAKHAALDLAAEIAGKLWTEVPVRQDGEAWLTRAEQYLSALPEAEREALAQQLVDGAELKVTTASPLPVETREAWRGRLQRLLGDRATVSFGVDRHLFTGAELHFPSTILSFSWQSALEAMRAEIGDVDDPR
jgi:F-type H+-transporting ATPase subunit b